MITSEHTSMKAEGGLTFYYYIIMNIFLYPIEAKNVNVDVHMGFSSLFIMFNFHFCFDIWLEILKYLWIEIQNAKNARNAQNSLNVSCNVVSTVVSFNAVLLNYVPTMIPLLFDSLNFEDGDKKDNNIISYLRVSYLLKKNISLHFHACFLQGFVWSKSISQLQRTFSRFFLLSYELSTQKWDSYDVIKRKWRDNSTWTK